MKRRELLKVAAGSTAALVGMGGKAWGQVSSQTGQGAPGAPGAEDAGQYRSRVRSRSRSLGAVGNATVERVHVPRNARSLQVHLLVNAAIHHTARLGEGPVDIGVKVTLFYTSGGQMVALEGSRQRLGLLPATPLDAHTTRVIVRMPFGSLWPDPGTTFDGRAQLSTRLPGNVDVPFGPAE